MQKRANAPQLDSKRIAAAALAVLDKHGIEGFTIRAVAKVLRVTPMALYHHVEDKAALANLVVEAATVERKLAAPTGEWREDLWEIARWMRACTQAHPAVIDLRRLYRIWNPSILSITERWLVHWQASGLEPKRALQAASVSSLAVSGLVAEETAFRAVDMADDEMLSKLPAARALMKANNDPDVAYELGVRSLIDGLYARLSRAPRKTAAVKSRRAK